MFNWGVITHAQYLNRCNVEQCQRCNCKKFHRNTTSCDKRQCSCIVLNWSGEKVSYPNKPNLVSYQILFKETGSFLCSPGGCFKKRITNFNPRRIVDTIICFSTCSRLLNLFNLWKEQRALNSTKKINDYIQLISRCFS